MQFLNQRSALIVALTVGLASAQAGAAVILDQKAETAAGTGYGLFFDPLFMFDLDGAEATPKATAGGTLPSLAADGSMATAETTVEAPLRTVARTGGVADDTRPLGARGVASWQAIYRDETAPGETEVDSDLALHVSGTLAVSTSSGSVTRVLATIVPESASFLLLVSGLLAFAYARSRSMTARPRKPSR